MQRRLAFKPSSFGASLLKETDTVIVCEIVVVKTFQQLPFPPIIWNKFFEKERRGGNFFISFSGIIFRDFCICCYSWLFKYSSDNMQYIRLWHRLVCVNFQGCQFRFGDFDVMLMRMDRKYTFIHYTFIGHFLSPKLSLFICIYFYAFFEVSFKKVVNDYYLVLVLCML